ncbi:extracellular solute-binding protein [Roseburia sp. 499]|uniref:extracellular solute-binding protein n=1 Tax=Roseburia sp. 499 TaxID=1261634 RepID=UPI000950E25D|nr:extracellular solute-binding protein [Roseburia sp. 499]WVK70280.1 extracellular solute-binding protein [Roseburia sp. 499]
MKRFLCCLLCGCMTMGLLAGCGNKENEGAKETGVTEGTDAQGEKENIVIWHDGDEGIMDTVAHCVNEELKDENIQVTFEKKSGLTDQLQLYGNDEANGPDMYFYAHDSLGMLVEMGILAPITDLITESDEADMLPMTIEAGTYKDTQYMLPVYFETLLFMYNKDLWEGEVPNTTDDLLAYMEQHTDVDAGTYAVVNQHSTAYNVAPFINGFGGYIINESAEPGLNLQETKDAITYNQKFAALQADGDYNTVTTLFNDGKAAAIIGGPWLVTGINAAGINLGIKSLSEFALPNGEKLAPYSGVQGVGVMKYAAENKKDAVTSVLKALASEQVGIDLAVNANCAPANQKSYEDAQVSSNEMITAMKTTAETAQPMPNIPQMSVMWGPAESLLAAVNKSGEDVNDAADQYQKEAESAITDMQ